MNILLLISVYCFGFGISAKNVDFSDFQLFEKKNQQGIYFSLPSNALYFHAIKTETFFSGLTEYTSPNFNPNFEDFWAQSLSKELLLCAKFKQYNRFQKNRLVRYRKSDLIFPFHYFW